MQGVCGDFFFSFGHAASNEGQREAAAALRAFSTDELIFRAAAGRASTDGKK